MSEQAGPGWVQAHGRLAGSVIDYLTERYGPVIADDLVQVTVDTTPDDHVITVRLRVPPDGL
jgi:hypothetical protein